MSQHSAARDKDRRQREKRAPRNGQNISVFMCLLVFIVQHLSPNLHVRAQQLHGEFRRPAPRFDVLFSARCLSKDEACCARLTLTRTKQM